MAEGVIIRVGLDGAKVTQSLKTLKNAVKASTSQMKAEMAVFDRAGDSLGKLNTRYEGLQRTIKAQDLEVQKLREAYNKAAADGNENSAAALKYADKINTATRKQEAYRKELNLVGQQLKEQKSAWYNTTVTVDQSVSAMDQKMQLLNSRYSVLTAGVDQFGATSDQLRQTSSHLTEVLQTEQSKVEALRTKYETLKQAKGENDKATQAAERELNNAIVAMKKTETELKNVSRQLSATGQASKNLDRISSSAQKVSEKLTSLGRTASIGITLPVVGGLTASAKSYMDFNNELIKMRSLLNDGTVSAGVLDHQISVLGKDSQKWSQQYGESTSEVNQGMEELIKKGYTYNQVIGAMPTLLNAARATGDDFGTVMSIASSTLEQFNLKAKDTATMTRNTRRVTDDLSYVANKTAADFDDMGVAMSYVGPVAHSVGYSLESTASAIGLLSNNGIEAEKAGTALRGAISRMLKPTNQSAKAFEAMGISTDRLKKGFYTLPDLLDTINKNTQGMTKAQKAHLITQAFGVEAQTGMNVLLSQGGEALRHLSKETQNASGYTKKLSDQMGRSDQLQVKKLISSFHVLEQTIGQELVPEITPLIKDVTHLIKEFGDLSDTQKKNIIDIALFAAAIGPASLLLGGMLKPVALLTGGLGKAFGAMSKFTAATKVMGTAAKVEAAGGIAAAAGEAGGLAGALGLLVNPVGITIGAVGALGLGAYELYKHFKEAGDYSKQLKDISLDTANSMMKQHDTNTKLIDSFDKLRSKSKLTIDQFAEYLDLQSRVADGKGDVEAMKKRMDDLRQSSGLSNKEFKTMVDLNKKLTDKMPEATEKITEQGNRIAKTTDKLKAYNKELADNTLRELEEKRLDALKNADVIQKEIKHTQSEYNAGLKAEEDIRKRLDNWDDKANKKKIEQLKIEIEQAAGQKAKQAHLEIELQQLEKGKQGLRDQLAYVMKNNDKTKEHLDDLKKQGGKLDEINKKMSVMYLEEAGITEAVAEQNVKKGTSIDLIDLTIAKLTSQKKHLDALTPPNQRNTAEYRDQVAKINDQIDRLKAARGQIVDLKEDAAKYTNELAKKVTKKVSVDVKFDWGKMTSAEKQFVVGNTRAYQAIIQSRGYATGTDYASQGWHWVGEKGPELLWFDGGEKVIPHNQSVQIASLTDQARSIRMMSQVSPTSSSTANQTFDMSQTNALLIQLIAAVNNSAGDTVLTINDREFARATAPAMQEALNQKKRLNRRGISA